MGNQVGEKTRKVINTFINSEHSNNKDFGVIRISIVKNSKALVQCGVNFRQSGWTRTRRALEEYYKLIEEAPADWLPTPAKTGKGQELGTITADGRGPYRLVTNTCQNRLRSRTGKQ